MEKEKKKTLTISSNLKKKIDTSSFKTRGKKSFSVEKKKFIKPNKEFNKPSLHTQIRENSLYPQSREKRQQSLYIQKAKSHIYIYIHTYIYIIYYVANKRLPHWPGPSPAASPASAGRTP